MSNIFSVSIPVTPSLSFDLRRSIAELNSFVEKAADELNPYSSDFRSEFFDFLKQCDSWPIITNLWPECRRLFPGVDDSLLIRYILGCYSRSEWRWVLYSAVFEHNVVDAHKVLDLLPLAVEKGANFDEFLFNSSKLVPTSFASFKLPQAIDYRYQLAHIFHQSDEINLEDVASLSRNHASVAWRHHHERKLKEFYDSVVSTQKAIKKIDLHKAKTLILDVLSWMSFPLPFLKLFALQSGYRDFNSIPLVVYAQNKTPLDQFILALTSFDFVKANHLALELKPLLNFDANELKELQLNTIQFDWVHSRSTSKSYKLDSFEPLDSTSREISNKVLQLTVPPWCSMPLSEMADHVVDNDELRSHLPQEVLCVLACAKEGIYEKKAIKWRSVSENTLLAFTPNNTVLTKWYNSRKATQIDPWLWFKVMEAIQSLSPECITTNKLGAKAYEYFVERHIGTDRWYALGGSKLHKHWHRDVMSFLANPNTHLNLIDRVSLVADNVFQNSSSKDFINKFMTLVEAGLPDNAVITWQANHPTSDLAKRVLEGTDLSLRNRFVNQFIGSSEWRNAGGEKLHVNLPDDICNAIKSKLIDKSKVDFISIAQSVYKKETQNSAVVACLFRFFNQIGCKMKSILAITNIDILISLIEDGTIRNKAILRKICTATDSLRLKAASVDWLIDSSWDDPKLIREIAWRVSLHLPTSALLEFCSNKVEKLANVLALSCDFVALDDYLNSETDLDRTSRSQLLREAADVMVDFSPFRSGCLSLLSLIGHDCAKWLKFVVSKADWSAERGKRLDRLYHTWKLPKKSGGNRLVSTPHIALKLLQKAILARAITPLGVHSSCFGFVPHRSISMNADKHVGQEIVVTTDISNCFPSVSWKLVRNVLKRDFGGRLNDVAIGLLLDICTSQGGLPIGAPTSPGLLNRVLYKTDQILTQAAKKRGCNYSRYADDLIFSGDHGAVELLGVAKGTLQRIGLNLDVKKTNIFRRGRRQMCTGLVVNEKVSVPRAVRKKMRAAVHAVENGREPTWHGRSDTIDALKGRLSFLCGIQPEYGKILKERLLKAVQ